MAFKEGGWVSMGSNQRDFLKTEGIFRPKYHIRTPESDKEMHYNCQLCNRKHGNKRKNKVLIDENRGIEIETGVVTSTEKAYLIDTDGNPMDITLCQECKIRIEIEVESTLIYDEKDYAYPPKRYRFKRKNELAINSKIVSLKKPSGKPEYDFYGKPDWLDSLDYQISSMFKVGTSLKREDMSIIKSDI